MTDDSSKHNDDLETRSANGSSGDKRPLPTIDRIASFRIDKTISSGGGGTVFLAYDESMKRQVALKVLHPSLSITPTAQQRFAREAWIAGQLEHANIIKVYSRGEEKQLHYIAMEFADGGSLSDYIKNLREAVSSTNDITATANREHIKFIVNNFIELVGALEHIHSKGFIHRDIKPHNILLSGESKQFKLTDFGIAHAEDMTRMTKAGDFMGTIHYMSPEQISAHRTKVDKRTDIYSLGVTLYEALTLSLPFEGDSEEKLIGEIIAGHYIPARKRSKTIPRDLETILIKATHHDPQRRYQSAAEFAEDLQRFLENRPILAKRDNIIYRARKSIKFNKKGALAGLALLVFIIFLGIFHEQHLQTAYDNEKILYSLQRAVETKTSPFEFEPDWPRLSKKLYEQVKRGKLDSTMIWFLRTVAIPEYQYQKYTLLERAAINVRIKNVRVFEDLDSLLNNNIIHMSILESTIGDITSTRRYIFYRYFVRDTGSHLMSGFEILNDAKINQTGEIKIPVKFTTKYYFNSTFYQNIKEYEIASYEDSFELVDDTLMKMPHLGEAGGLEKYAAMLNSSMSLSTPVLVDSQVDTVELFTFQQWPDDFPRSVLSQSLDIDTAHNFMISKIEYVKLSESQFRTRINCRINTAVKVPPIASYLEITDKISGRLFLTGSLIYSESIWFKLNFKELALRWQYWQSDIKSDGGIITERTWFHKGMPAEDSVMFNTFVKLGKVDAELKLMPSIDLARETGEMSQFWGDTLIFNITFQAIDSTGVQAERHTEKVSKEHLGSILFDSTFLIKYH